LPVQKTKSGNARTLGEAIIVNLFDMLNNFIGFRGEV